MTIEIVTGDITEQEIDAIVNSANPCIPLIKNIIFSLLLFFVTASISYAATVIPSTESLIEKCNKQARPKWESPITSTMNEGNIAYSRCLEKTILKLTERIYDKEKQKEAKTDLKTQFKKLSESSIGFKWKIENENKWCDCGTMMHTTSYSLYFRILEDMIESMLSVEKFHTSQD